MAAANKIFAWEGVDNFGQRTKGEIASRNLNTAKAELRKQGVIPIKVSKQGHGLTSLFGNGAKVKASDIALFSRQLATMIQAGIPLVQAFEIVAEGINNPAMRGLVLQVRDEVASGQAFAVALKAHSQHFDDLFCNLVDAGEQSGALETMLDRLATHQEKTAVLRAKIKGAIKYPLAVLIIAAIVSSILLIKVVPQFKAIFANFGAELPAFTQIIINVSRFMQTWWLIIFVSMLGTLWVYREAKKRFKTIREHQERCLLRLPLLGNIIDKSCIARFARTLSTTFTAGLPLVDALDSSSHVVGNIVYYEAISKIKDNVSSGRQLHYAMRQANIFPNMLIQMVAIGEESGALDKMLDKAANYYETMVDYAVDGLTSLLEPLVMSFLGIVVGGLIVAMYLPVFSIGAAIHG